jgi:UDP-glucose 4-epimerase
MKILVIGGAGYIGSHVAREFLDAGHQVCVYDNLSSGTRENLFQDADFVQGDILDYPALFGVLSQGFDGIIHLAALKAPGESMQKPDIYAENNITGTINILNAAIRSNVSAIVFSSSAAIYGSPQYVPIDENHPTHPESFYGFTKLAIDNLLEWYGRITNLRFASLRYFNACGYDIRGRIKGLEKNPANLLPRVMEVAVGKKSGLEIYGDDYPDTEDGTCVRDYIHVNDLASAHVLAMEYIHKHRKSLAVNLGSEKGYSVAKVVEAARAITGRSIPATVVARRPGDPSISIASSQKAQEILGWKPKYSDLDTILKSMWAVYQK